MVTATPLIGTETTPPRPLGACPPSISRQALLLKARDGGVVPESLSRDQARAHTGSSPRAATMFRAVGLALHQVQTEGRSGQGLGSYLHNLAKKCMYLQVGPLGHGCGDLQQGSLFSGQALDSLGMGKIAAQGAPSETTHTNNTIQPQIIPTWPQIQKQSLR